MQLILSLGVISALALSTADAANLRSQHDAPDNISEDDGGFFNILPIDDIKILIDYVCVPVHGIFLNKNLKI